MMSSRSQLTVRRYWRQAIIATSLVVVAPPMLVMWLERMGLIDSAILGVVASVVGSMMASTLGAAIWMQFARSNDVVFSDLLPWGFLRRMTMEKRILDSTKLMRETNLSATLAASSNLQVKTLEKLASALEATDPYTHGHSRRVARLSCMIAKQLGLPRKKIRLIRLAAVVHDVGKLHVPKHIINKPGKLTPEEFQIVQQHAAKGSEMVARTQNRDLIALVRHHHERMDGKGYPDGLTGVNIPLGARIIAVADTFDAITSTRSYRSASRHKIAVEALRKSSGTQLDREVVQAFLAYYSGKRSLARWAVLLTGPHRWFGELAGWFQGATAAGLKGSATAAVLTGSVLAGTAAAPAIAEHLPIHRDSVSAAEFASGRDAKSSPGHLKGLPPGLAKKDQLPPGLRKKDELPPGLAKQVSGSKKAHPNPPSRDKNKHDASVVTAGDASSGKDKSETTEEVTSLEQDDSVSTVDSASSGKGNSAIKSSKK
jgi:HD-GYP domain-containing protein (c-di-GMP phosphodiesterase class II)